MKLFKCQRGFSLIETVAVLIVVGVVIGGIWLAYSGVNRQRALALQTQQIADLVAVTRGYLSQFNEMDTNYYVTGTGRQNITSKLIDENLLPSSVTGVTSTPAIIVEYGTAELYTLNSTGNPYGSGPLIGMDLYEVSEKECLSLVNEWGGNPDRIASSGIVAIAVNQNATNASEILATNMFKDIESGETSLAPPQIEAACSAGANQISLFFRLNK